MLVVLRENHFGIFRTKVRPLNNHSVSVCGHAGKCAALKDKKFSKAYYEIHIDPFQPISPASDFELESV
jgi:hypothetical protein